MQSFIEKLKSKILHDKSLGGSYQRYPIRLIFVNDLGSYKTMVEFFEAADVNVIELSSTLVKDDGWIDPITITNIISKLDSKKDSIVVGVSELMRFYKKSNFEAFIQTLFSSIENKSGINRRIYIPFVGLYDVVFNLFKERFHRIHEITPYISLYEENEKDLLNFYITDVEVDTEFDECIITSTREWMDFWKKGNDFYRNTVICSSETLNYWYKNSIPDNILIFDKIENIKELIQRTKSVVIPLEYIDNEKVYWQRLLEDRNLVYNTSFEQIIKKNFSATEITLHNLLMYWFDNKDKYKRWLLKSYVKNFWLPNSSYLWDVMMDIQGYDDIELVKLLWFKVFELSNISETYYKDRYKLLKTVQIYFSVEKILTLEQELEQKITMIDRRYERINVLTDITNFERSYILNSYSSGEIEIQKVRELFPDLYSYIISTSYDNKDKDTISWVNEYIEEYKTSKIKNTLSDRLRDRLATKNKDSDSFFSWYYGMESLKTVLQKERVDKVIVVDALGLEWVNLFESVLSEFDIFVQKRYIARANLPTITRTNKNFEYVAWIKEFDKNAHESGAYDYPISFLKEIKLIREIVENKIGLEKDEVVAIVADHGLSIMPHLVMSHKAYSFEDSEHEGRCLCLNDGHTLSDCEDYVMYESDYPEYHKWAVSLNYTSLNRKPIREVHGGATPEEVLIPILIVSTNKQKIIREQSKFTLIDDFIDNNNTTIRVKIEPTPSVKPIVIDESGINYIVSCKGDDIWSVDLKGFKGTKIVVKTDLHEREFSISVKKAMKERDLF
ncbi:MAG: BREX-4 system phosphatase PglZ [Bacillota bacterium]